MNYYQCRFYYKNALLYIKQIEVVNIRKLLQTDIDRHTKRYIYCNEWIQTELNVG